jgi:biopolymer transport protein ExbB
MSTKGSSFKEVLSSAFSVSVIFICVIAGYLIWKYVMGDPINFEGGNPDGHPKPGNYLAIIYKGGVIVPILIAVNLILLTFVVERAISLARARGRKNLNIFVRSIQAQLAEDKIEEASALCDIQKGSLANVMKAGLKRYRDLQKDSTLGNDQKVLALQKELEEASALEMPILSRNLVIMSTVASISVLIGLIGTVLGMIKAFAALATAGSPDALALATGISEALINTAFGIIGSTLAIIFYNYYSSRIDSMTFKIDESGFSLAQTFASTLKK